MKEEINELVATCHGISKNAGWYTDLKTGKPIEPTIEVRLMKLALVHTEISEAVEGARKNLMDDHLPNRKMEEVELADAMIRIADYAGFMGYDLGGAVVEKLEYNQHRKDHKLENRRAEGGKEA